MTIDVSPALVQEMNSLHRRPQAQLTVERFLPEWSEVEEGGAVTYAHGHSAVVVVDGNGVGEDVLFRARISTAGELEVAAIKGEDLDNADNWEALFDGTGLTDFASPAWSAGGGPDFGGSLQCVVGHDNSYIRIFAFQAVGDDIQVVAIDFDLEGDYIITETVFTFDDWDEAMQLGSCKSDELYLIRHELVEGGLSTMQSNEDGTVIVVPGANSPGYWQKDVYGTYIYRFTWDGDSWEQDPNPFLFHTHWEGHLVKDGADLDSGSEDIEAQWGFRPCGGLAVLNINADTALVALGARFYNRKAYKTHTQSLMAFFYHRDNGLWERSFDNDEADYDAENQIWLDVFARGCEVDNRKFITWVRLVEPSESEQVFGSEALPRVLESVFTRVDQTGRNYSQHQYIGSPEDYCSCAFVAINHGGSKRLFVVGYTAISESAPCFFLCDVPDDHKLFLGDEYTNNFGVTKNNRFGMSVKTTLVDALARYETFLKEGMLVRAYQGIGNTSEATPALNLSFPFLVDEEGWELETDDLVGANPSWSLDWNAPGSTGGGLRSNADSAFFSEWRYPLNRQSSPGDTFQARVFGSSIGPGETNLATFYIKVIYDDETFEQEVIVEEFINWDLLELTLTQSKQALYVALGVILNPEEFNSADLRYDDIVISMQEIAGSVEPLVQIGMGFIDSTVPNISLRQRQHSGPITARAELYMLHTRAESIEDTFPMQTVTVRPDDPGQANAGTITNLNTNEEITYRYPANVDVKDGQRAAKWTLRTARWPGLFFGEDYSEYEGRLMFCDIGFPFAKTGGGDVDLPPGVEGGPGAVADDKQHRKGTFYNDLVWTSVPEPRIDGAIQATVRFGDNNNAPDGQEFEATTGCNVWAEVHRTNGLIDYIDWLSDDCSNPPGMESGLPEGVWNQVWQESCMAGLVCRSVVGTFDELSQSGKKYMFLWEANANFGQGQSDSRGSHLGDQAFTWWRGTVHDKPEFRAHVAGRNKLYLFISDYDEENENWIADEDWTHAALLSCDATGLTPGKPADMKLQVLGGTIYCFYRPVNLSNAVRNHWRLAFFHKSGHFGAGKFGIVARGHAGIQWDTLKPGKPFIDPWENQVGFCDIEATDCERDSTLEEILRARAWRGLSETEFRSEVDDAGPHEVEDGQYYNDYELVQFSNFCIDFTVQVDTNGAEAGLFLRSTNNEDPLDTCAILGLTFNSTYKQEDNTLNCFATFARYDAGVEVQNARDYSPSALHLKPLTPYRVRVTTRNDLFSIWVEGNYVGHFHNEDGLGKSFGFYAKDGTATFTNIRVAELHDIPDNATLDPNQNMFDALKAAIGRRHIKGVWRGNTGKLLLSYFKTHDDGPDFEHSIQVNAHKLSGQFISVAEVWGAEHRATYVNPDLIHLGRRYSQFNNPDLMTVEGCYREAGFLSIDSAERMEEISFSAPPDIRLEPEDESHVTVAQQGIDDDYIVDDVDIQFNIAKRENSMQVSARKKVFDVGEEEPPEE